MNIKGFIDEDFVNYKKPSMYIAFPTCSFKCDKENGCQLCQNWDLVNQPDIEVPKEKLIERYLSNPLTEAIVLGGLEPFDSEFDLLPFLDCLRRQYHCKDTVVIYTGYTEEELEEGRFGALLEKKSVIKEIPLQIQYWNEIKQLGNIIVKFGRYRPNEKQHFDKILGVNLSSNNQYAKKYF